MVPIPAPYPQVQADNMRRKGRAVNKVKEYDNLPVELLNDVSNIKRLKLDANFKDEFVVNTYWSGG